MTRFSFLPLLRRPARLSLLLAGLALAAGAAAQGRGGGVGVGLGGGIGNGVGNGVGVSGLPNLPPTANPRATGKAAEVLEDVATKTPPGLVKPLEEIGNTGNSAAERVSARRDKVQALAMTHPERLSLDPRGELIVRGEVVLADPPQALLEAARAAGFRLLRERRLAEFDSRMVVLAAPPGLDAAGAAQRLRELDPAAAPALNHVYLPSGTAGGGAPAGAASGAPARVDRLGLIDGGVDAEHPALRGLQLLRHGCDKPVPSVHGTATASLLAGRAGAFHGAAAPARLFAADVYCGQPTGGALDAVVDALAWMAHEKVPVINISLVGPANPVLQRVVAQMTARGHLLVAAVGNDGPAAPPLYPAAYPGVVGVSGVDPRRRVLPEAGQGPQVAFVAPGAELAVAAAGGRGYSVARGTSFAAPLVAGMLAAQLPAPDPEGARRAVEALARSAVDLGAPGRDPVFGYGLVAEPLRIAPERVAAR
jgi:hypothetical protein